MADLFVGAEADAERGCGSSGWALRRATSAMISATPALSSAPSNVEPSEQTRS